MSSLRRLVAPVTVVAAVLTAAAAAASAQSIEGAIYDVSTGEPLSSVQAQLQFDVDDPQTPGALVPPSNLAPGQQGQVTGSGGRYRFDLRGLSGDRRVRVEIPTGAIAYGFPSRRLPASTEVAPSGAVVANFNPVVDSDASRLYFLRFAPTGPDYQVSNNHIALDALSSDVETTLRSSRTRAEVGDVITLTVSISNRSRQDLVASRRAFLRLTPARGLDIIADSARARIEGGEPFAVTSGSVSSSERIAVLGPIEIAAGEQAVVQLRAVVGVDTRPGQTISRAVLVDGGGVLLSNESSVTVEVEQGRGLESSLILGRVFCDDDGDHELDEGEKGVFGARVFIDTGSYSITDSGGLFHFSRVPEGTRYVKVDGISLGASRVRGDSGRLLRLTPGLPGKVSFPVRCKSERVAGSNPQVALSHLSRPGSAADPGLDQSLGQRLLLEGDLLLLAVKLDGQELALPSASARLEAPESLKLASTGGVNLKPVPSGGFGVERPRFVFGFQPPTGVVASRWMFVIAEASLSSGRGTPFFTTSGVGDPPAGIDWDGRGTTGTAAKRDKLYVAQLVVIGSRAKIEAASPLVPFGVGFGQGSQGPSALTWRGSLFGGSPETPTGLAMLTTEIDSLAKSLGPGDTVAIEVHSGAIRSRVEALATTQRRADLVKSLLVASGVDGSRIVARGRGAAEPVATGSGAADKNRRVEVRINRQTSANLGVSVPSTMSTSASALVDGQPVEVDDQGRFRWEGAVPKRGALLIDVQALDGRRAAIDVALGEGQRRANRLVREVTLSANLDAGELRVGELTLDPRLLELDVAIRDKRIEPTLPSGLAVKKAEAVVSDGSGKTTRLELPANGGGIALPLGLRGEITVRVIAELEDGSRAYSPRRVRGGGSRGATGAELIVNGVTWPVVAARAEGKIQIADGGAVLVDVTQASGQRAIYVVVLRSAQQGASKKASSDAPVMPTFDKRAGSKRGKPVSRSELLASAAADFWIELPPANSKGPRRVPVRGWTRPGNKLSVAGRRIKPAPDGSFATFVELPAGRVVVPIVSEDSNGFRAELRWPLQTEDFSMFGMALGELIVATSATERGLFRDTAFLAGMSPETTWAAGPLLIHGRATLYLKGTLAPSRVFKKVGFTVHLDTSKRRDGSAFFEDVLNPVRDQPSHGDSSIEVRDTAGRGKLYVRFEADESEAVVGALAAELGRGRLFRYGRTVDGIGLNLERAIGRSRVELDAFGTTQEAQSSRDHVVYRSTGGTLYYLRFSEVVEGSELIRVIVRDRDSGLVASERVLRRNVDYSIDYISGRVWLIEPVQSSESSPWVLSNSDASLTPESGNPVYIEARYEHRDLSGLGERAAGVEARFESRGLSLSAGAVGEFRDGPDDYGLLGARAAYGFGKGSRFSAEIAESKRRDGAVELSVDGGLSFRDLAWSETLENPTGDPGLAWHVGARIAGEDLTKKLEGTSVELYAQHIEREFSSIATELERGRLKFGGRVVSRVGKRDDIMLRFQGDVADVPRIGPTRDDLPTDDVFATDERETSLASVGWVGRRGRFTHQVEAAHHRLTSTAERADGSTSLDARRAGVGGRSSFAINEHVTLSAFQELWVGLLDDDPLLMPIDPAAPTERIDEPLAGVTTGVGIGWRLVPDTMLTSELRQRWNGDQSASIGLRSKLSAQGSFYIAERAERTALGPRAVTVIGADDRFGPGGMGRSYGEYQLENAGSGARNRAVLGLGQRWRVTRGLGLGLGFEHQQIFGGFLPDGTPVGNNQRDLIRASMDVRVAATVRLGAVVELRADRGEDDRDDADRELIDADPRDDSGSGFADHGGVAPGAPLVLPGGDVTQAIASLGLTWRPQEGVSLFARARGARTWQGPSIGFTEVTTGLAYRSLFSERLALLMRYSFLRERRPEALALEREEAHVLAAVPVAQLSKRWRLSGKLAFKRSIASGGLAADATSNAVLALMRLGYRVFGNWDVTVEGRSLALSADERELKAGALVELGYYFDEFFRLGIGYNFSHFNDQELGDLTRDAHGLFLRLTAEI